MSMFDMGVFLDQFVRPDDGTAVLLCVQRECVPTATALCVAFVQRSTVAETVVFDVDDELVEAAVEVGIADLRALPHVRRVAVIVCEPCGPSLRGPLEAAQGDEPAKLPIFRISGRTIATTNLVLS